MYSETQRIIIILLTQKVPNVITIKIQESESGDVKFPKNLSIWLKKKILVLTSRNSMI